MIHLYCGMGKGKTTAACGLCVRAAGSGMRVLFVQFFKDGSSSEIRTLSSLSGVEIAHPRLHFGRFGTMTEPQKEELRACYGEYLQEIIRRSPSFDLIVLDESVSAYMYGMLEHEALLDFLSREGQNREIVLTGRDPAPELTELADYVTEMRKVKHPFDRGIAGRKGIEF